MGRLLRRVVFLTGAGGALGGASAVLFAREGARVAVVDAREEAAAATVRSITDQGGEALALMADVREEAQVRAAVDETVRRWGHIHILFNNAGIMPHADRSFLDMDPELWATIYDINLRGTAMCSKYAVPHIIAAGGGAVVNMGSFLEIMGCTNPQDAYAASKGAVAALTRSMAVQLGRHHIHVNALCPGPIETPHVQQFFPTEEARRVRLERIPMGRFGRPEDVAELALYLASDASSWMTGQTLYLDGGISVNYL
jgi:NAD(P)-dependent dehydrogenase (short-subunit alcohol dehydrogenase family)